MVYLNNGYGTSLKSHVAYHKLCHKIVFGEHVTKMQQNLEVQCARCTNTFVTKCTCLQVSKGSTKTTRAAQGKRHMSPNGSVKVSTNLFYAQAECWDLSRGSIWCNWKVCENQAKKLYLSRNYCKVYVDHCGPCVCFDWKVRFPVTHLPWLECNHWLDHMVNSNAYNQNGRKSAAMSKLKLVLADWWISWVRTGCCCGPIHWPCWFFEKIAQTCWFHIGCILLN